MGVTCETPAVLRNVDEAVQRACRVNARRFPDISVCGLVVIACALVIVFEIVRAVNRYPYWSWMLR